MLIYFPSRLFAFGRETVEFVPRVIIPSTGSRFPSDGLCSRMNKTPCRGSCEFLQQSASETSSRWIQACGSSSCTVTPSFKVTAIYLVLFISSLANFTSLLLRNADERTKLNEKMKGGWQRRPPCVIDVHVLNDVVVFNLPTAAEVVF